MNVIPTNMIEPLRRTLDAAQAYVRETNELSLRNIESIQHLIHGLQSGYKHHNLNCISFKPGTRALCGFTMAGFMHLLKDLKAALKNVFTKSRLVVSGYSNYCEIRFKLYLC
jgi:radical SAM superfamily enzyme